MNITQNQKVDLLFDPNEQQLAAARKVRDLARPIEAEWPELIAFDAIETPDIPTSLLPSWLGEYAKHVAAHTQTPEGMSVMLALSTVSTCLQRRFEVSPTTSFSEPVNIWTMTSLPPGSRKTAVFNAFTGVLRDWERDKTKLLARKIAENKTLRTVQAKRIDKLERDASNKETADEQMQIIKQIAQIKADMPAPLAEPMLWTGDVTAERLQNLLIDCGEKMSVLSDEGGIFSVMAGMYNDDRVNIDVFLQSHAGSPVRVERSTRSAYLTKPALTFGLTVQPDILSDFAKGAKKAFRGKGALARFLYCIPKSNIGQRDVRSRYEIPAAAKKAYESGIKRLLDLPEIVDADGNPVAQQLTLSADAVELWSFFMEEIEYEQGEGKAWECIQDWTAKLASASLRIAGLCHVVEYGHAVTEITSATMDNAIQLCRLLVAHALAAFDLIGANQNMLNAKYIIAYARSNKRRTATRTELKKLARFSKVPSTVLDEAIAILLDRNYICFERQDPSSNKPTTIYSFNPKCLG